MKSSDHTSPALQIHVSSTDGTPIYLQIVGAIRLLIASGRLSTGDELPPIRVLAEKLLVNPNTVAHAYRELESNGLVEKRSTAGTFVAESTASTSVAERHRILGERIEPLLAEAKQLSVSTDQLVELIREHDDRMTEKRTGQGASL